MKYKFVRCTFMKNRITLCTPSRACAVKKYFEILQMRYEIFMMPLKLPSQYL